MELDFGIFSITLINLVRGALAAGFLASLFYIPALGLRAYGGMLRDAAIVATIAAVLFVPIIGLVLKDSSLVDMVFQDGSLVFKIERSLMIVGAVLVGRLLISGAVRARVGMRILWRLGAAGVVAVVPFSLFSGVERNLIVASILLVFAIVFVIEFLSRGGVKLELLAPKLKGGWATVSKRAEGKMVYPMLFLLGVLVVLPFEPFFNSENPYITDYHLGALTQTLIYVLLAMGLNIVVGLAGLLDLGFVAFYAVGAYGYALITLHLGEFGIGFWWALPITASLAAFAGCLLGFPVLRMHGDYLAIVTLGFGEIIRVLLVNMIDYTGGPNGMSAPRPTLMGLEFTRRAKEGGVPIHEYFNIPYDATYRYTFIYLVALALALLAIFVFKRLREMPIGRAWEALREDETASKALGINHTTTKLSAFTLGAAFAGVGGVLFAANEGFISPSSFTFVESAIILSMVVLGGMGSITGVILAAAILTLLPELFRDLEQYRMLGFGLAMVFIMIWRPGGLIRVRRRSFVRTALARPPSKPALGEAD